MIGMTARVRAANCVFLKSTCAVFVALLGVTKASAAGPIPIGTSTVTVGYDTTAGPVSFSGDRAYLDDATGPGNSTVLGAAPNIRAFNSIDSFGRRTFLANSNPIFAGVLGGDETLVTHAFFKNVPTDIGQDFFPDLVEGGGITIEVGSIEFATPATIDPSTMMLHALWNPEQADQLGNPYINLHNHHTQTDPFRDSNDFLAGGIFSTFPVANFTLGDLGATVTGNGTTSLALSVTIPYTMLQNLEELGQVVPPGLPAPQGFLEPFHFHIEYAVTPEPSTLALLILALLPRRRRPGAKRTHARS